MTPKEKAKELLKEYSLINYDLYDANNHKECALIAVDEILKQLESRDYGMTSTHRKDINYWKNVKEELLQYNS